jgi:putative membrane protein (TIGR04086 family)
MLGKMESYEKSNALINILKGVGISVAFTLICLLIFSCLLVYTNISESLMQPVIIVITGISILLGSSIGNRKATKNGIINGASVGVLYILTIYIISSIISGGNFVLNMQSIIMMIIGIIGGMIGGIIGVNIK